MSVIDCNSILLSGITTDCEGSLGGIKKVWITRYSDVVKVTVDPKSDTDDRDDQISKIELKDGAKWYEYQFRKDTSSLTMTHNADESTGINYVQSDLSLVFTKMDAAKRLEMTALCVGQTAAIVEDANGHRWYLGLDEYVSASAGGGQTGVAKGDQNAYTITLSAASKTYPYEVKDGAFEADIA